MKTAQELRNIYYNKFLKSFTKEEKEELDDIYFEIEEFANTEYKINKNTGFAININSGKVYTYLRYLGFNVSTVVRRDKDQPNNHISW